MMHPKATNTNHYAKAPAADAGAPGWTLNKTLLALGAAGPVLFLVVSTLLGFLDPDFDVMTEPVSALAWGPLGWVQTANFYVLGAATIAFAVGLYRDLEGRGRMGAEILLSVSGLALILAGIFKGTPPGAEPTPSGMIHGMAFFWTFIPLPTAYALDGAAPEGGAGVGSPRGVLGGHALRRFWPRGHLRGAGQRSGRSLVLHRGHPQ